MISTSRGDGAPTLPIAHGTEGDDHSGGDARTTPVVCGEESDQLGVWIAMILNLIALPDVRLRRNEECGGVHINLLSALRSPRGRGDGDRFDEARIDVIVTESPWSGL